ncbi:MAG: hypothetical protein FJ167_12480 [Gammaproteobacteria bacterium]|nr:hypothetical protein [Gammaproteobacteria bacterium]
MGSRGRARLPIQRCPRRPPPRRHPLLPRPTRRPRQPPSSRPKVPSGVCMSSKVARGNSAAGSSPTTTQPSPCSAARPS